MSTRRRSLPMVLVMAALLSLLWPVAAHADPGSQEIGLSRDGVTWAPELSVALFEPERRWVPGDEETRSFQLRNQGPSPAAMTVEALSHGGVLAADVSISLRVGGGSWIPLEIGSAPRPVTVEPLPAEDAVAVDVRATFDAASGNRTQNVLMPLTLRITLVGDVPIDAGDDDSGGPLPDTGSTVRSEFLLAALAACLVGAVLRTRRQSEKGDAPNEVTR